MNSIKISVGLGIGSAVIILAIVGFSIQQALPFLPFAVMIGASPLLWSRYTKYAKLKAMEDALPEFLRNLTEAQRSGINLPQAIISSSQIEYGPLSSEIKVMAAQLSWGIPLQRVLKLFSERVAASEYLTRSIAIIIEAYRAGGNIAEVMESTAESARVIKELEMERKSKFNQQIMIMYAIFIIFIVIIVALNRILIPIFSLSASQDTGEMGFSLGSIDPAFYRTIFLHMILIQAIFGGLIAGQVGEGSVVAGIKHSMIMLVIGSIAFFTLIPANDVILSVSVPYQVFPPGSTYELSGTAILPNKAPLTDAEISIQINDKQYVTRTDSLGTFTARIQLPNQRGNYEISLDAKGTEGDKGSFSFEVSVG
ncbi:MAG: hypothetical protein GOU99_02610 [Candidatus Altiarchaeota archaeon]|nr:hypothetical protein [Candidatus Altiarchaeota archaeon]